jgi:hypothetical protein
MEGSHLRVTTPVLASRPIRLHRLDEEFALEDL